MDDDDLRVLFREYGRLRVRSARLDRYGRHDDPANIAAMGRCTEIGPRLVGTRYEPIISRLIGRIRAICCPPLVGRRWGKTETTVNTNTREW